LVKTAVVSGREVCAILARQGFVEVRRRGSHVIMQKKAYGTTITIPVPDHNDLRMGTLKAIIRQSGLPRSEFLSS
jgi:predicted RNA binding protein YcfA (HicA-like mRNA interferase family)